MLYSVQQVRVAKCCMPRHPKILHTTRILQMGRKRKRRKSQASGPFLGCSGLKSRVAWGSWVVLVLEMSDILVLRQVYDDFVSVWCLAWWVQTS